MMKLRLELSCEPHVRAKARYVIASFLDVLGIPLLEGGVETEGSVPILGYGHMTEAIRDRLAASGGAFIHASTRGGEFFRDRRQLQPQEVTWARLGSIRVPILFPGTSSGPEDAAGVSMEPVSRDGRVLELDHDIVLSAFYFLSRWEETVGESHDGHGRFLYRNSLASKLAASENIVDLYLDVFQALLNEMLKRVGAGPVEPPLWDGRQTFVACLTHDVDVVHTTWRSRARSLLNVARPYFLGGSGFPSSRRMAVALQVLRNGKQARWTFPEITSLEAQLGFRSSFYFQAHERAGSGCDYGISEPRMRALLGQLLEDGFEVGLHGSYQAAFHFDRLRNEKRALEAASGTRVAGHRQHYLRLDYELTMPIYERAGLEYDSTLGFAEQEGYRNQFSYPYRPYDISRDHPFSFLELPLVIMDTTLYGYRRLTARQTWETIERLLQKAHRRRGCITILWHNASFCEAERPAYGQIYVEILRWIKEHNGLGTTGAHVSDLWRTRNQGLVNGAVLVQSLI